MCYKTKLKLADLDIMKAFDDYRCDSFILLGDVILCATIVGTIEIVLWKTYSIATTSSSSGVSASQSFSPSSRCPSTTSPSSATSASLGSFNVEDDLL